MSAGPPPPLTPEAFQAATHVSRETLARLEAYAALLRRWQPAVNLVAASTLPDLWRRHMLDSAQLLPYLPCTPCPLADLGSGAGFPGLVLAIMGAGAVELVEADARKCAFLREAIRVSGAAARVREGRLEADTSPKFAVATARALAPLAKLLDYAEKCLAPGGIALFLKGKRLEEELTDAGKAWKMTLERFPSLTDPGGWVLRVREITRVKSIR
ncbi:MAG TPA: 16S rRNA (guanine(527)-N(7))-methyltransferase RsmG [Thermoanaerobaculia bacterium]|nr:16S rRNA (guanine(527)-N(7))-methyltransferase RsmG [Thermoanaerobaculia bacterium]